MNLRASFLLVLLVPSMAYGQCTESSWTREDPAISDGTNVISKVITGDAPELDTMEISVEAGNEITRAMIRVSHYRDGAKLANLPNLYLTGGDSQSSTPTEHYWHGPANGESPIGDGALLTGGFDVSGVTFEECDELRIEVTGFKYIDSGGFGYHQVLGVIENYRQVGWEENSGCSPGYCWEAHTGPDNWGWAEPGCVARSSGSFTFKTNNPQAFYYQSQNAGLVIKMGFDGTGGDTPTSCPNHSFEFDVSTASYDSSTETWTVTHDTEYDDYGFLLTLDWGDPGNVSRSTWHFYGEAPGEGELEEADLCETSSGVSFVYTLDEDADDGGVIVYLNGQYHSAFSLDGDELLAGDHVIEVDMDVVDGDTVTFEYTFNEGDPGEINGTVTHDIDGEPDCNNCGCAGELTTAIYGSPTDDPKMPTDEESRKWRTPSQSDPMKGDSENVFNEETNYSDPAPEWFGGDDFNWPYPEVPTLGHSWLDHLSLGLNPSAIVEQNLAMTIDIPIPVYGTYSATINTIPQNNNQADIVLNQLRVTFKNLFNVLMVLSFGTAAIRACLVSN